MVKTDNYPKISIVTPSLNQGRYIVDAIKSVLVQNYPKIEHIIIDGGSTDNTIQVIRKYPHINWISEPGCGQTDALNKGFRMSTGDIIGWLNTDDRYLPGCFDAITTYFNLHLDVDVVYGDYNWINELGEVRKTRKEIDFDLFILKYLHVLYIPSTASFFRRRIFDDGNFLDIAYHYAMDYEFYLRLAVNGYQFRHMKYILADYRWHTMSKSSKMVRQQMSERELALLKLDPFFKKIQHESFRDCLRLILLLVARIRRTRKKILEGCFW